MWRKFFKKITGKPRESILTVSKIDKENILALREDGIMPKEIANEINMSYELVARVLDTERKKQQRNKDSSQGADELKEIKLEIKRTQLNREKMLLEHDMRLERMALQAELQEMTPEGQDEELDPMAIIASAIAQKFLNPPLTSPLHADNRTGEEPQSNSTQSSTHALAQLTPELVHSYLLQYPKQVKKLQKKSDTEILQQIQVLIPNRTPEEYKLGLDCIKKFDTK